LPLGVGLLYTFHEDTWAILVIEIILLECEHFVVELFTLILPLQIFLKINEILNIFVEDISGSPPLLDDLIDHVGIEVDLRSCIFVEQFLLDGECS
jgi:hypothetical protein